MTAVSVDTALSLIAYFSGRGQDVDLHSLPDGDLERTTLQLALLVRRCLGQTDEDRFDELARFSLHLQCSDLEHPEAVDIALTLVGAVTQDSDERYREPVRLLFSLTDETLDRVARRLAWSAHGLLGDTDAERDRALADLSLMLQLVQFGEG